jgi:hypothetical protein
MSLVQFRLAGSGGEDAYVNPAMVVCLMQAGRERTQVVTAGLAGETSISIVVDMDLHDVAAQLNSPEPAPATRPQPAPPPPRFSCAPQERRSEPVAHA